MSVNKQAMPIAARRTFRSPGAGRFVLEPMKDDAHPEPAHENGNDPGDETGDERGAKRVHRCESNLSILARAEGDCPGRIRSTRGQGIELCSLRKNNA